MMSDIVKQDIQKICDYPLDYSKLNGKTVFVTGATGFIGFFIVSSLAEKSIKSENSITIIALVRSEDKAKAKFAKYIDLGIVKLVVQDITKPIDCQYKADYIIHCASNAAPDKYAEDPVGTMKINFYGTLNMLEYAKFCKAQNFLYVSTIEVFGRTTVGEIAEEDFGFISTSNVRSCYPESKKCCESLVTSFAKQYNINANIGRLSYIYGSGMSKSDSKVCALFARKVAKGEDIVLKSEGKQLRSYTYITDAITALLTILIKGESGESYNIASKDSRITIAQMAQRYCALFPEKSSKVKYDLPTDYEKSSFSFINNAVFNSSKLEALGWNAKVSLNDGIKNMVKDNM